MPEDANQLTCLEFQRHLCALLASDESIEEHPHYKTCLICRHVVRSFEEMIDNTLGEHIGAGEGPDSARSDDWSEST
ncbi:MAG: hypothetical protein WCA10_00475 [Terracidiphilus sp.]